MDIEELYKPIILENIQIDGVCGESTRGGENVEIIQSMFISSLHREFDVFAKNILNPFLSYLSQKKINDIYVLIKEDGRAFVYEKFPFGFKVFTKKDVEAGTPVFKRDIFDVESVFFKNKYIDLNPKRNDKIIWIFRCDWNFGLYFNLTKDINESEILYDLGTYYKQVMYLNEYIFIEKSNYFKEMINDGWFPFIEIINNGFENIIKYYEDKQKDQLLVEFLIESFSEKRMKDFTSKWWKNEIFNKKKDIIEAGIESYLLNTKSGYINSIKNLLTELEGIIRISFFKDFNKIPTTKDLKDYISDSGKNRFTLARSLAFPDRFLDYLNEYIFKGFNLGNNDIPESRHSVAHGVATDVVYNREFALKVILTMDNIFYFLNNKTLTR